jgi:ABC-type glycerol-3-phosphate transport system substrate-binding protein
MHRISRRSLNGVVAAFALTGLLLPAAQRGAAAQTLDQLYEAAKVEKTVVLWGAGPAAGYEAAARAFEQKFPGITVALTGGFSNVLNAQVEEQFKAGKVATDILIFQTVQDFVGWNRRGLLMHFKPEASRRSEPAPRIRTAPGSPSTPIRSTTASTPSTSRPATCPNPRSIFSNPGSRAS